MAKKYFWLKLYKDFFKRHDIAIIEDMENGKDYVLFYLKLLLESLSHQGYLRFSDTVPYDEKMLVSVTRTNIDVVRSAIKLFTNLNMMEILDDGTIYMNEVQHMIGSETEWAERKRLYREKQRTLEGQKKTMSYKSKSKSIELDKELDINNNIESKDSLSAETDPKIVKTTKIDYISIANYWNSNSKLKEITKITETRKPNVNARIKEHGLKSVFKMIDNAANSSFLRGQNNRNWIATFDWCFKPKNFVKILEGNYLDSENTIQNDLEDRVKEMDRYMGVNHD